MTTASFVFCTEQTIFRGEDGYRILGITMQKIEEQIKKRGEK